MRRGGIAGVARQALLRVASCKMWSHRVAIPDCNGNLTGARIAALIRGRWPQRLALAQIRPEGIRKIIRRTLRSRKDAGAVLGDKTISTITQGRSAMCCCQIPPYDNVHTGQRETTGSRTSTSRASTWMYACFVV